MRWCISYSRWILLVKACVGARSARKSKTRNTARTQKRVQGVAGGNRRAVVPEDGKRRKREAPNTQHNPAASSASMDFKRSPRLLLFPFLSFSFFYYYFRGADGCARSRPRIQCAFITCVHVYRVYVYTCLYTYSLVPGWARLGLGWMRGNHGRLWVGSLVSRRDYRRVLKLIVTEVTSGQRQWPEREWRQREREPSDKKRRGIEW